MEISRRVLYEHLKGVKCDDWSDTLMPFCREPFKIADESVIFDDDQLRKYTSRFAGDLERRLLLKSRRDRKRFEKKFDDWLNRVAKLSASDEPLDSEDLPTEDAPSEPPAKRHKSQDCTPAPVDSPSCSNSLPSGSIDAPLLAHADKQAGREEESFLDCQGQVTEKRKPGRPPKLFSECGKRSKNMKTEDLRLNIPDDVLFYAVEGRLRAQGLHKVATAFQRMREDPDLADRVLHDPPHETPCTPEQALCLFVEGGFSKKDYQTLRNTSVGNGSVLVPPYSVVASAKLKCYPEGMVFTDKKAEVPLQSLLDHTAARVLLAVDPNLLAPLDDMTRILLVFKYGMDGMGSQSQYKQGSTDGTMEVGDDKNMFICSTVPILMSVESGGALWKNEISSSPRFCRPLKILFEKETDELVREVDMEIKAMIKALTPLHHKLPNQNTVHISYELRFTMADGKVCNILTHTASSNCFVCQAPNSKMNDLSIQRVVDPAAFNFGISPLHAKLRSFELLLKVGQKIDVEKWKVPRKEEHTKIIVEAKKFVIQKRFRDEMALIVDVPRPGGGTSNDGNTARRFFKAPELSANILGIDPRIVRRFAVITGALAYNEEIDPEAFAKYAKETAELYVDLYEWYPMSPTVHKILIHGKEFLESSFLPLGTLSEEAQEALNKYIRLYRNRFSRKDERKHTVEDIFKRLMIFTDPYISSLKPKKNSRNQDSPMDEEIRSLLKKPPEDS